jgi:predicted site-specific integrase-resolvase
MTNLAKARGGAIVRPGTVRALRVNEYCDNYRVCRSTAYALMRAGTLRSVLVGGRRLIPVDAAEALIAGDAQ